MLHQSHFGSVAKVRFEAENDTPYSGIFTGAKNGIIRLSSPVPDFSSSESMDAYNN